MKFEINVPVSGLNLANLLEGERGLFLSQNRGQTYLTIAKPGHPIAFGPMPIGLAVPEPAAMSASPEPWVVTKISDSADLREFQGANGGR
jgi:hypothetical protein